jgi:hypothetical protein
MVLLFPKAGGQMSSNIIPEKVLSVIKNKLVSLPYNKSIADVYSYDNRKSGSVLYTVFLKDSGYVIIVSDTGEKIAEMLNEEFAYYMDAKNEPVCSSFFSHSKFLGSFNF